MRGPCSRQALPAHTRFFHPKHPASARKVKFN